MIINGISVIDNVIEVNKYRPHENLVECEECFAISIVDLRLGKNIQSFNGGIVFNCPCCGTSRRWDGLDYFDGRLHLKDVLYGEMTESPLGGNPVFEFLSREDREIILKELLK